MNDEPTILETNTRGELVIPSALLGVGPLARVRLEQEGPALRLIPERTRTTTAPEIDEQVRAFREWLAGLPKRQGPPIPADALRRENMYD